MIIYIHITWKPPVNELSHGKWISINFSWWIIIEVIQERSTENKNKKRCMILWAIISYNQWDEKFKTLHLALCKTIFNKRTKCERLEKIYQFRILTTTSVLTTFQTTQIHYQHLICFIFGETSGGNRDKEGKACGTVFF